MPRCLLTLDSSVQASQAVSACTTYSAAEGLHIGEQGLYEMPLGMHSALGSELRALVSAQGNISRTAAPEEWRFREAATYAFGSMLEGPSTAALSQLATSGMGFLLNAMTSDPSQTVRHTTAWTLGAPDTPHHVV